MVERTRRLRVGLAHSSPGVSGVTARPNYVGPSGNGLVKRMNAGRKPGGIKGVRMGAPVRLQKAVPRSKENAAVERREVNAHRTGRAPQGVSMLPAPFGAPLPSHCEGSFPPHERGGWKCPALPAPCENRGGGALGFCAPAV